MAILGLKPGATNSATVNLATGNVTFPVNLFSLPGRNGLDFNLAINYNSNVRQIVDTCNLDAPTSVLGLGWSFIQDQIVRNTRGTGSTLDDSYFLVSGGTMLPLTRASSDAQGVSESQMLPFGSDLEGEIYKSELVNCGNSAISLLLGCGL
jgi:hypothetical protein